MTIMKNALLIGVVSSFSLYAQNSLKFVEPSYFMHLVEAEDCEPFKEYYRNSTAYLKKLDNQQKAKELAAIRKYAYDMLSIKRPQLSAKLKTHLEDVQVTAFLTRYGILERYLTNKAQQQGIWYKIKSYTQNIGRQIAQWTGSFRKVKVAT